MPISKHRTNRKNKDRSRNDRPAPKIDGLINMMMSFPDTSCNAVAADSRSYRERAHIRKERAEIRRAKRKLKRIGKYYHPIHRQENVNQRTETEVG